MSLVKTGEAEILDVLPEGEQKRDDREVRKAMVQASEDMTKNSLNQIKTERR